MSHVGSKVLNLGGERIPLSRIKNYQLEKVQLGHRNSKKFNFLHMITTDTEDLYSTMTFDVLCIRQFRQSPSYFYSNPTAHKHYKHMLNYFKNNGALFEPPGYLIVQTLSSFNKGQRIAAETVNNMHGKGFRFIEEPIEEVVARLDKVFGTV